MTSEFEVGANLKFFNGRIDIDASYYNRDTNDQIFTLPVDPSTGFSAQVTNFGKVRKPRCRAYDQYRSYPDQELYMGTRLQLHQELQQGAPMPESLEGGKVTIYSFSAGNDAVYMYAEQGKPLGQYYTYLPQFVTQKDSPYYGAPIVGTDGQPVIGSTLEATGFDMNHDWTGGITTSIRIFDVTLSAAFDIRYGGKMFSRTKNLMQFTGNGVVTEQNERRPFIIPGSVVATSYDEKRQPDFFRPQHTAYLRCQQQLPELLQRERLGTRRPGIPHRPHILQDSQYLAHMEPARQVAQEHIPERCSADSILQQPPSCGPARTTVSRPRDNHSNRQHRLAYGFGELYSNPSCRSFGVNLKVNF